MRHGPLSVHRSAELAAESAGQKICTIGWLAIAWIFFCVGLALALGLPTSYLALLCSPGGVVVLVLLRSRVRTRREDMYVSSTSRVLFIGALILVGAGAPVVAAAGMSTRVWAAGGYLVVAFVATIEAGRHWARYLQVVEHRGDGDVEA